MTTAIYPGSFDPITNGHLDIVKRASSIFDKVVVGIYDIPQKSLLFTMEERVNLARKAVENLKNVEVMAYSGITVGFAQKIKAHVLVRGLRANSDFEREFEMALMNKKLAPDIELVCFMANLRYQFLSSSLLKEIIKLGGNLDDMVPPHVCAALKEKLLP
ncbi:MAG: pantetheine-phosphate adenylyltransferase [Dehalococcoidia bacterium]|nr:pantetheine-phosphate adenylyltransferase [Dehalococcoidia bacterium]MDD5493943.1 pantetheine-phosphate adenylyltransferase [Dehalococcoidia bacterium]